MSFQKMFASKSPFRSSHGDENARSFGGYHEETGEVIDARTGRTPSEQKALNDAYDRKIAAYPDEYARYNDALDAYEAWNDSENSFGFGGLEYPNQSELDSIEAAWKNMSAPPIVSEGIKVEDTSIPVDGVKGESSMVDSVVNSIEGDASAASNKSNGMPFLGKKKSMEDFDYEDPNYRETGKYKRFQRRQARQARRAARKK
tara:strand:+ start:501 stop:1106 length:606 start_codon:yes stop_codon:yes gene_type:complete